MKIKQKTSKIPLRELVKHIPFRMAFHMNNHTVHSSLYKNKRLNVVCETHVYFENGKPTEKSEKCFYEDRSGSRIFNTLKELLKADKDTKEKAYKLYENPKKTRKEKS